jgi:hypothetical protein
VFFALSTILPRFKTSDHSGNLFFFGSIIHLTEDDFLERFVAMSHDDIKAAVLAQIRAKSFIAHTKFRKIRWSLLFLFAAVIMWGMVTLLPAT